MRRCGSNPPVPAMAVMVVVAAVPPPKLDLRARLMVALVALVLAVVLAMVVATEDDRCR